MAGDLVDKLPLILIGAAVAAADVHPETNPGVGRVLVEVLASPCALIAPCIDFSSLRFGKDQRNSKQRRRSEATIRWSTKRCELVT